MPSCALYYFLVVAKNTLVGELPFLTLQEFEDRREAEDAIYEMNGKELMGGRYVFNLSLIQIC